MGRCRALWELGRDCGRLEDLQQTEGPKGGKPQSGSHRGFVFENHWSRQRKRPPGTRRLSPKATKVLGLFRGETLLVVTARALFLYMVYIALKKVLLYM